MIRRTLALVLGLVALGATATAGENQVNAAFYGLWLTPVDGGGVARLEPCGDKVCGFIVESPILRANPDQRDIRNSDPALRDRRLVGLQFLEASPTGADELGDGWVYDPEEGETYSGTVRLLEDGRLRLKGCIIWPLCRSQTWQRVG